MLLITMQITRDCERFVHTCQQECYILVIKFENIRLKAFGGVYMTSEFLK